MTRTTEKPDPELTRIARQAMTDRGLYADFTPLILRDAAGARPSPAADGEIRDMRALAWCSIDNDDSRDLDQLTVAEAVSKEMTRIFVAVADVDALVRKDSPTDQHAKNNTTSVYCPTIIFPMLPEKLSYDLTSLNEGEERLAVVVEMDVTRQGRVKASAIYRARVHNKAKLTYSSVGPWLEGQGQMPDKVRATGLEEQLRLQDRVAQRLKGRRHVEGALDLETIEPKAVVSGGQLCDLQTSRKNRAHELIEDFMIAANGATARFLQSKRFPSFRRVVRSPERWARIVEVASELGVRLPADANSKALEDFLVLRRKADPLRFPDLSTTIVKLMGRGEYIVQFPDQQAIGHFGLAVRDYAHSTAPNRRYPDVITQRLVKAALAGVHPPYDADELQSLAAHCTKREDDANKVERLAYKSAAAKLLAPHVGKQFDGIVTGASPKGTWVRIFRPPAEGRMTRGFKGLDVGQTVRVRLVNTDVEHGFIDFEKTRG